MRKCLHCKKEIQNGLLVSQIVVDGEIVENNQNARVCTDCITTHDDILTKIENKGEIKITARQQYLLNSLHNIYMDIVEEYENDEKFSDLIIDNAHLFPMSIDELACEFFKLANGDE